jgi:hypothetical protein
VIGSLLWRDLRTLGYAALRLFATARPPPTLRVN